MSKQAESTEYAPAERASTKQVRFQTRTVTASPFVRHLYDAIHECVAILNPQRQIVFCNQSMADLLGLDDRRQVYGLRPGEALGCIHALRADRGCGTAEHCSACGAVNAFLENRDGQMHVEECRILRGEDGEALDLLVKATPLSIQDIPLTIIAITDISDQKRREVLERTFLHDMMNTLMALRLHCRRLEQGKSGEGLRLLERLQRSISLIQEEIEAHRDLLAAESGELAVVPSEVDPALVMADAAGPFRELACQQGCSLLIKARTDEVTLRTDRRLLRRVLCNMVKNAVEASSAGQTVTAECRAADDHVEFSVHNESCMPREVQLQLFKRSFSTKGAGRGLGAYSMKLLTERYLGGRVEMQSSPEEGTTFIAAYPTRCPPTPAAPQPDQSRAVSR